MSGILQSNFEGGNIRYNGNNQIVSMEIKSGTRVLTGSGAPAESITVQPGANIPAPPSGENIISAVELGPSGVLFSSPIKVVFGYDTAQLPQGTGAADLTLRYYDTRNNKWIKADYSVDTQNHQINAKISHFSLYAVMASSSSGFKAMGWIWAGMIIMFELLAGGLVIFYMLRRRKALIPAPAAAAQPFSETANVQINEREETAMKGINNKTGEVSWDDLLHGVGQKGEPFKTHLEIIGGKIVIPRDGKSADIELINNPDSRILISLENDPELHPKGLAKIVVLGAASEFEKN